MNSDNSTPSTAAHSSKRPIVVAWVGVNLATSFPIQVGILPGAEGPRRSAARHSVM